MLSVNGKPINVTHFPDGTSQVWQLKELPESCTIDWEFSNEGEVMELVQLVHLLRQEGANYIQLHMSYLPYARQDKEISNETAFALASFGFILNSLKLDRVMALDAHSLAANYAIDNFTNEFPFFEIQTVLNIVNPDVIAFPDKGARTRYGKNLAYTGKEYITGDKVRDQKTGLITDYSIDGNVQGCNVLMIDDICDGGTTFVLMAKALLTAGAKSVSLYTTHGIYSKGVKTLFDAGISRVFNQKGQAFHMAAQPWGLALKPF